MGSQPTLAYVPVSFYALLQLLVPSGAAGSLRWELAFPLGLFSPAKGFLGHAEPIGVLIRAHVSFLLLIVCFVH